MGTPSARASNSRLSPGDGLTMASPSTLFAVLVLAFVHVLVRMAKPYWLATPRPAGLSVLSGLALAFAYMHDVPSLIGSMHAHPPHGDDLLGTIHEFIYLFALAGFAVFFGIGKMLAPTRSARAAPTASLVAGALVAHALTSAAVGYLLAEHVSGATDFGFFLVAYAAALFVLDGGLAAVDPQRWARVGCTVLVTSVLGGWIVGILTEGAEPVVASVRGFVVGAVGVGVLQEEMRDEADANLWAFLSSTLAFSALILLLLEID